MTKLYDWYKWGTIEIFFSPTIRLANEILIPFDENLFKLFRVISNIYYFNFFQTSRFCILSYPSHLDGTVSSINGTHSRIPFPAK